MWKLNTLLVGNDFIEVRAWNLCHENIVIFRCFFARNALKNLFLSFNAKESYHFLKIQRVCYTTEVCFWVFNKTGTGNDFSRMMFAACNQDYEM